MIHQGTPDEGTTSETIRHNTLYKLWLTERDGRAFDTTLWNYAARDSEERHDPTQHLGTQAERTRVERSDTTHTFFESLPSLPIGNPGSLCVTRDITQVNYREHMRRSLGLKICWKMEIKIVETYHVASFFCP